MSASVCASCLSRLRISSTIPTTRLPTLVLPFSAQFSTTTAYQNVLKKKTNAPTQAKYREARGAKIKKKHKERPRPPAPGERKAQKKRIVLSNTNALEVEGLESLSPKNMIDAANVGHMLLLNGPLLDQLRESKSFKTTQNWSLFRQPSTLVRQETIELGQDINEVITSQQDQGFGAVTIQKIITGERGSGKSIHLLQAQCMAFLNGWVVINIPECQDLVINTSSYNPTPLEDGAQPPQDPSAQLYDQPKLVSQVLSRIASSNGKVLANLKLVHSHPKTLPFKANSSSTLLNLAEAGANDHNVSIPIFQAFWKELTQPSSTTSSKDKGTLRPPVLVTMDGLEHWMIPSLYRSSDHKPIHAHQLTLVQHFLSLLFPANQTNPFPQGGMVLAATSASNSPTAPSLAVLLSQLSAQQAGVQPTDQSFPMPIPFSKTDDRVLQLFKNSQTTGILALKGLSRAESKGLLEYFARSGMLKERVTEGFIGERWTLSGGGVVGELAKLGKRIRL